MWQCLETVPIHFMYTILYIYFMLSTLDLFYAPLTGQESCRASRDRHDFLHCTFHKARMLASKFRESRQTIKPWLRYSFGSVVVSLCLTLSLSLCSPGVDSGILGFHFVPGPLPKCKLAVCPLVAYDSGCFILFYSTFIGIIAAADFSLSKSSWSQSRPPVADLSFSNLKHITLMSHSSVYLKLIAPLCFMWQVPHQGTLCVSMFWVASLPRTCMGLHGYTKRIAALRMHLFCFSFSTIPDASELHKQIWKEKMSESINLVKTPKLWHLFLTNLTLSDLQTPERCILEKKKVQWFLGFLRLKASKSTPVSALSSPKMSILMSKVDVILRTCPLHLSARNKPVCGSKKTHAPKQQKVYRKLLNFPHHQFAPLQNTCTKHV